SPYEAVPANRRGMTALPELYELGMGAMEKLRRVPGWSHVYRVADRLGGTAPKRPVVFECVGVPGMIDGIVGAAPLASRVVVVGVCMGDDKLRPAMAIGKEIDLRFVFGYTPLEFRDTLHMLADGKLDASALVTGTVGLGGVAAAFDALGDPEAHAKILIDPSSEAVTP
ncbi:MAG: alcohol dehydrogenase, partial [Mycobacterium sp.]|nr:alcohol dehydrogenase [Mycobacterium sp.]